MGTLAFPTGTVTVFRQTAAPQGWTKLTTQNDASLRLVNGVGGGTGGSVNFSAVHPTAASQPWPGTATFNAPYPGSTDTAPAPSTGGGNHSHTTFYGNRTSAPFIPGTSTPTNYVQVWYDTNGSFFGSSVQFSYSFQNTPSGTSVGGGAGHAHPFSATGSGTVSISNWNLRYVDVIFCSKQ